MFQPLRGVFRQEYVKLGGEHLKFILLWESCLRYKLHLLQLHYGIRTRQHQPLLRTIKMFLHPCLFVIFWSNKFHFKRRKWKKSIQFLVQQIKEDNFSVL